MSSPAPVAAATPAEAAPVAAVAPAAAADGAPQAHAIRRQLVENRFANQKKRRAWEAAKEKSTVVCASLVGDFVRCTEGRMFSVVWACRRTNAVMTKCMKTFMETNDDKAALDAAKQLNSTYD